MASEKGSFSTEIGDEVIQEALRSVERQSTAGAPAAEQEVPLDSGGEVPIETEASGGEETEVPVEPTPEQKEIDELKAQLEFSTAKGRELLEKLREAHDQRVRAVADLDNFKKRAAKEKEEIRKFGVEKLLKDFLPVADNLDRALEHAHGSTDYEALRQGIEMTRKLLADTLGKHGVTGFSAVGQPFDPHLHEAIQQQETSKVAENTVVSELVRGYMLNERLVRPAMVVVAKAPPPTPGAAPEEPSA